MLRPFCIRDGYGLALCTMVRNTVGNTGVHNTAPNTISDLYIAVVNWKLPGETIECVESLLAAGAVPGQIIVVDNGSDDDSVARLRAELGDAIDLIASPSNLGFAGGNNLAIQRALDCGAEWILLANNDTIVDASFFTELAACAQQHPAHSLIAPLILYHRDYLPPAADPAADHTADPITDTIWSLGDRLVPGTLLTRSLLRNRPVPNELPPFVEVDFLNACGVMIHRRVFERIGLFDPSFFMYAEDVDLCWRARRADFRMGCATDARMWHKVSRSTGVHHPRSRYWRICNQIFVYRRYAQGLQWPLMFGFTAVRAALLVLRDLRAGRGETALRTVQAWLRGWFGPQPPLSHEAHGAATQPHNSDSNPKADEQALSSR